VTYKAIVYSDHAAKMLKVRRLTRSDVRWLIARGVRGEGWSIIGEKRLTADGKVGKRNLRLVFIERANEIEIVTVMEKW